MIIPLDQAYDSRYGAPLIDRVDTEIFTQTYFARCMDCTFCKDSCCQYGVDVDVENVARIMKVADTLEPFIGVARDQWFEQGFTADADFPGGQVTRTRVKDGACVFLNRQGRGCQLHRFALQEGFHFNDIKPLVSAIFPVTFAEGCLYASDEIPTNELICQGPGPSLYEGAREDLLSYFGPRFTDALDVLQAQYSAKLNHKVI